MRSRLWKGMLQFWTSDRGLPIFLLLLIFVVFILPVAASPGPLGRLASDVVLSLLLVAGAMAAAEPRWVRRIVPPIAALALLVRWASAAISSADLAMWRELSTLVTLMLFAIVVAAQVFRRGRITPQRIQGAVAVYLLLGLAWASAYELLYLSRPGAFAGSVNDVSTSQTWIYYSFQTLTTMGYGDITPVHPIARSLAVLEALSGQVYLTIMLARLVGLQLASREDG
ncbi:MAG: potassium channel family protein [Chromatiales bacterium]